LKKRAKERRAREQQRNCDFIIQERKTLLRYVLKWWYEWADADLFSRMWKAEHREMRARFAPLVGLVLPMLKDAHANDDKKEAVHILRGCAYLIGPSLPL
jgi:hypothetical protein